MSERRRDIKMLKLPKKVIEDKDFLKNQVKQLKMLKRTAEIL